MIVHAGLVSRRQGGRWRGVLITGPSGAGKSDLALRLIDEGFSLTADDRVLVWTSGGRLYGRAPDVLAGLIEIRGVGVRPHPALAFSPIDLVIDLQPAGEIERIPTPQIANISGISLPKLALAGFEVSAGAKVRNVLMALG